MAAVAALALGLGAAPAAAAPAGDVAPSSAQGGYLDVVWKLPAGSEVVSIEISPTEYKDGSGSLVDRYTYTAASQAQQFHTPHKFINGRYFIQVLTRQSGCTSCSVEFSRLVMIDHSESTSGPASKPAGADSVGGNPAPASKQKPKTKKQRCVRRSKKSKKSISRSCTKKRRAGKEPEITFGFGVSS